MLCAKLLVVEDETIVAKDIQNNLKKLGYTVTAIAMSGKEAISKVSEDLPDLVLMDISLKGDIDGLETAKYLQSRYKIPVIYLTAYADDYTLERAQLTEPLGYILKPFKARELHATIQVALSKCRMERKLKEHEQWLATVLKSIGDAVIATDNEGLVTFMNPVAEAITGWSQQDALGRDSTEVFHIVNNETRTLIEQELFQVLNEKNSNIIGNSVSKIIQSGVVNGLAEKTLLVDKRGVHIPVVECAAPIQDDTGCITGVVIAFRDITQQQQAEVEIHKALVKEKELNELKSHFISTASHEFRTPLATILSSVDMLELYSHKWNEQRKIEHFHRIQTAAESMTQLLDDVLLVSKAEAGKLQFNPVSLNLLKFCSDLAEEMQLLAEAKHTISFVSQGECDNVCLDEKLLRHILSNLLSNAVKYSPLGGTIQFQLICNQIGVTFHITDQGIGIPPADKEQLFQSFYRASNVGTTPGTGLGLTIVKKSVDLHGGQINVTSEVGVGTTFTVIIPIQK